MTAADLMTKLQTLPQHLPVMVIGGSTMAETARLELILCEMLGPKWINPDADRTALAATIDRVMEELNLYCSYDAGTLIANFAWQSTRSYISEDSISKVSAFCWLVFDVSEGR